MKSLPFISKTYILAHIECRTLKIRHRNSSSQYVIIELVDKLYNSVTTHWTYLLQMLSKLCFQRVALTGNYEILAISTDKNTFLMTLIIKLTLGNIFKKTEKSARWRHRHKIIKTNLKILVSRLLSILNGLQTKINLIVYPQT